MKLIDKSAVVAETERLQNLTMDENKNFYSEATEGEYNALCNIEHFINSMQEEPVNEDLEKAASQDACEVVNTCSAVGIPNDHIPSWVQDAMVNEFIHGAKWKERQMQSTIKLAEEHAMFAGMSKIEQKTMETIKQYVDKGQRNYDDSKGEPQEEYWGGFSDCAEQIMKELKQE